MNPRASFHHRRPHWVVSGGFWSLLVLADLAILSIWAAIGAFVLALCCGTGLLIRHRRLLATAGASVVMGPGGTPVEATPLAVAPEPPPCPAGPPPAAPAPVADAAAPPAPPAPPAPAVDEAAPGERPASPA
ncbi:hypothetical protein [Cryptosporangium aurantiacum]|uniref:Uncharacterized protein n=1 Tax=Cryptosporangium aurantiacum TaxID=134849 RepID=A0A1M7R750_9ACTN|nr:hypothetical protein [Cryptosporangium aurantiacum]SHN41959.1 hypothetical protein SAMN05443668_10833 [Cryptosporangium aurantiacum]